MAVRKLQNVRPRPALSDEEEEPSDVGRDDSAGSPSEDQELTQNGSEEEDSEGEEFEHKFSNVSFGALKQAQDALSRKRKRGSDETPDQNDKLAALRERLQQMKQEKTIAKSNDSNITREDRDGSEDSDSDDSDGSDSGPSEEDAPTKSRTSKHAPAAQSSKRQVTRKRVVVDVPKRVVRDPRFDALQQRSAHSGNSDKAYSFLQDYQKSEIDELKTAIKQTKNEEDKDALRRKVGSMENRLKAKAAKERVQEVIRRHRKEERERVEQGKTPYYLKKKDVKERALVEKFKGMKGKEREKLIEKRRKKEGQKEKKRMPEARRITS